MGEIRIHLNEVVSGVVGCIKVAPDSHQWRGLSNSKTFCSMIDVECFY